MTGLVVLLAVVIAAGVAWVVAGVSDSRWHSHQLRLIRQVPPSPPAPGRLHADLPRARTARAARHRRGA